MHLKKLFSKLICLGSLVASVGCQTEKDVILDISDIEGFYEIDFEFVEDNCGMGDNGGPGYVIVKEKGDEVVMYFEEDMYVTGTFEDNELRFKDAEIIMHDFGDYMEETQDCKQVMAINGTFEFSDQDSFSGLMNAHVELKGPDCVAFIALVSEETKNELSPMIEGCTFKANESGKKLSSKTDLSQFEEQDEECEEDGECNDDCSDDPDCDENSDCHIVLYNNCEYEQSIWELSDGCDINNLDNEKCHNIGGAQPDEKKDYGSWSPGTQLNLYPCDYDEAVGFNVNCRLIDETVYCSEDDPTVTINLCSE